MSYMNLTLKQVQKMMLEVQPETVFLRIPEDKRQRIPDEIYRILTRDGLSFRQMEVLLDIVGRRLRKEYLYNHYSVKKANGR